MIGVILRYLLVILSETLKVAGQSMLKAAAAAAVAGLLKGLVDGVKQGISKAKAETAAAPA
jgi:hypothetical protein